MRCGWRPKDMRVHRMVGSPNANIENDVCSLAAHQAAVPGFPVARTVPPYSSIKSRELDMMYSPCAVKPMVLMYSRLTRCQSNNLLRRVGYSEQPSRGEVDALVSGPARTDDATSNSKGVEYSSLTSRRVALRRRVKISRAFLIHVALGLWS